MPKVKIVLTLFQIISSFPHVLDLAFPSSLTSLLNVLEYSSPLTPTGTSFSCSGYRRIDFIDTLMLDTLLPMGLSLLLFVVYTTLRLNIHRLVALRKGKSPLSESKAFKRWLAATKPASPQESPDQAQTEEEAKRMQKKLLATCAFIFVWLIFLILPKVTVTIFNAFPCVDIDPDGVLRSQGLPTKFLSADLSISCTSPRYFLGRNWAIAMIIVYPVGLTFLYLYLLFVNRNAIQRRTSDDDDKTEDLPTGKFPITHAEIRFLWSNYQPRYWYWEVVETARRLMLTAVLSVIYVGTAAQILAGIFMSVCFVWAYDHFRPYPSHSHNLLQEAAEYIILLFLVGALLLRTGALGSSATAVDDSSIGVAQIVLVSLFVALVVHMLLMDLLPAYRQGVHWLKTKSGYSAEDSKVQDDKKELEMLRSQLNDSARALEAKENEIVGLRHRLNHKNDDRVDHMDGTTPIFSGRL